MAKSAAEGTKNIGSAIIETGSSTINTVSENPLVSNITEKSKNVIGTVGSTVSGATSVSLSHLKKWALMSYFVVDVSKVQNLIGGRGP